MRLSLMLIAGAALSLSACAKQEVATPSSDAAEKVADAANWQSVATAQDRMRVRQWYRHWQGALRDVREKGAAEQIKAEGALLDPNAALEDPALPGGDYRCRTLKLGTKGRASLPFVEQPWSECRVEDGENGRLFIKLSGHQRPSGRIFTDAYNREVFLGTMAFSDEQTAIAYGNDRLRDMAGLIERIGENRWRLVIPNPSFESLLDVIEIVPNI